MTVPPRNRKTILSDDVRDAVLADLALTHQAALTAEENDKVRIYLATLQGLDTYEIADALGISQSAVSNYRRQGREILERREREKRELDTARGQQPGEDPLRSGELSPLG